MNKTNIEWCDFSWNPVTGCWGPGGTAEKPNRCPYCYAEKIARRFGGPYSGRGYIPVVKGFDPFQPQFYPERLSEPAKVKKPSKIFVCSMADLFGDWVPDEWIERIKVVTIHNPHHTFQFLTKNPKRLKDFNPWPDNCWVGTTITTQQDGYDRASHLWNVRAKVRFISFEPLLGPINSGYSGAYIDWIIIGAQTGPGAVKPKPEWVQGLIDQYRAAGVALFIKNNLNWKEKIQEWPR